ncbi:hypothetical protein JCM3770_000476 [Rhodotorula araucariae]
MHSFLSLALVALPLAASAAASTAHYSHPRRADLSHGPAALPYRALPRSGRRLAKRGNSSAGQATLKCLSDHTFALCDGDDCTDMGAVAAGTMCKDNAITWDTAAEASSEASSAATTSYAEIPSPSSAAVVPAEPATTSAAAAAGETLTTDKKLANNAAVQLHAGGSSTTKSAAGGDDADWLCDSEDATSASSTSAVAAATTISWSAPSTSSAETWAAPPSSSAVNDVQLIQTSKAATSTQAPQTSTTSAAPVQTSSPASSGGASFSGRGTYYLQYGVPGSCGTVHSDSDYIVALSYTQVDSGAHCGKKVLLTNADNGKSVEATVADTCPGCEYGAIDLSEGAFLQLGTLAQGVLNLEWHFV